MPDGAHSTTDPPRLVDPGSTHMTSHACAQTTQSTEETHKKSFVAKREREREKREREREREREKEKDRERER